MHKAFNIQFPGNEFNHDDHTWHGRLESPHWGSLATMALSYAFRETGEMKFKNDVLKYIEYLKPKFDTFTTSEYAYILIGSSVASALLNDDQAKSIAREAADKLLTFQNSESGNIPSQWREAPLGDHLVDTIYTQNWAVLGLNTINAVLRDDQYKQSLTKALNLLISIQDTSPEKHLRGCWRGMYDLNSRDWGGGNRFEGGANSIYSGWTNAPISLCILFHLTGKNLINITK